MRIVSLFISPKLNSHTQWRDELNSDLREFKFAN